MFKKGDHIKVKEGTVLESGTVVNGWEGEIQEVFKKEQTCYVLYDAPTIRSLDDAYLLECLEEGAEPFLYFFEFNDIELSPRRDTDEELEEALEELSSRMIELEEAYDQEQEEQNSRWIEEFQQSNFINDLSDYQKEHAGYIIQTFLDFMFDYEYIKPKDWGTSNIKEVCLNIVPAKVTDDPEFFENYGDVLIAFLSFLDQNNYLKQAQELISTVQKIKHEIPVKAAEPGNWSPAKSIIMPAVQEGLDLSDEEALQNYLLKKQLEQLQKENQARVLPLKPDPFKGIGRNQKITVKYKDGTVLENVKFKKVQADLKNGLCVIVRN